MDTRLKPWLSILQVFAVTAVTVPALAACDDVAWVEGICKDDEVWVQHTKAGGGDCRPRQSGDPDCPEDQIPREQRPSREVDCVPNDISKEPYAE